MKKKLVKEILKYYLNSQSYKGYTLPQLYEQYQDISEIKNIIIELIKDNFLDLYYCTTNHFVKNFDLNISLKQKIDFINNLPSSYKPEIWEEIKINEKDSIKLVCDNILPPVSLFPTPNFIKEYIKNKPKYYKLPPFNKMLLEGMPHLHFLYFRIDVLNRFLYDPRYVVYNMDFTGSIYYKVDNSDNEKDENNIYLSHFGLAYNSKTNENVITIFPHDLVKLSLKHQYYFYSYLFDNQEDFVPDISYYKNVMGEIADGISIFSAFFEEMKLINKMFDIICGKKLFKKIFEYSQENRPEYFHPFMMPTKTMYHNFCRTIYRILVEQLDRDAIIAFAQKIKVELDNIEKTRPMTLLQQLFSKGFKTLDGSDIGKEIISIWKKELHECRNKISHSFVDDIYDTKIFEKYRNTINEAYKSVRLIRLVLSSMPEIKDSIKNNEIEISEELYLGNINMYFAPLKKLQ